MKKEFVIFPGLTEWSIARIDQEAATLLTAPSTQEKPPFAAIESQLRELGFSDEGVLLALPSEDCLCAKVSAAGLPRRGRETALGFRLEEQLPVAIEELTADFIDGGENCLGMAVETKKVAVIVDSLESLGISVTSICPAALLIAQYLASEDADAALIFQQNHVDFVCLKNAVIREWTCLPAQADSLDRQLRYMKLGRDAPIRAIGVGLPEHLRPPDPGLRLHSCSNPLELAALGASKCLSGQTIPPIELRKGSLASATPLARVRTPLMAASCGALFFFVCLTIFLFWRAAQYDRIASAARDQQVQDYLLAMPDTAPPAAITSRLRSEEKRLAAIGQIDTSVPRQAIQSVLPLLRDTLAALPRDVRYRIVDLRFEPRQLYLEGQTLDHAGADQIAASLRQRLALGVDPPHTQQAPGEDVNFTISATASEGER